MSVVVAVLAGLVGCAGSQQEKSAEEIAAARAAESTRADGGTEQNAPDTGGDSETSRDRGEGTSDPDSDGSSLELVEGGAGAEGGGQPEKTDRNEEAASQGGHRIEQGPFSVFLPPGLPKPTHQTTTRATRVGELEIQFWKSGSRADGEICVVGFSDYPNAVFERQTTEQMLENAKDGALRKAGLTLVSDQSVERRDGYAMKRGVGKRDMGDHTLYIRFQMYVKRPYLVQLQYGSDEKGDLTSERANRFFESLEFDGE